MNKNLILLIVIICIACGCQTVTSTHNIPQDNIQHDSLVYPVETSTTEVMPPMPEPMPMPEPIPYSEIKEAITIPEYDPEPAPVPAPVPEPAPVPVPPVKPIVIDMPEEPVIPKVTEPTPAPAPVPPVPSVPEKKVASKVKPWHIRTVSYADNAYNDVLAKKTKTMLEKNGISDVVIRKASNPKKTKSYIVVDAGAFETNTEDDAKKMQKKLRELENNKKKPFKDAFFVKY